MGATSARGDALDRASDELLADRAADGDTRAFAVLARRHGGLMRAYAARVVGPSAQSDDVAQEALITAWQQLPTLQDRAAVRAWLLRITTRKALDAVRAAKPHDDLDGVEVPEPEGRGPEQQVRAASLNEALDRSLRALPGEQGRVWVLRELGGYGYDEIADELGLPVSTVRGMLARARTRLIHDLDGWR